MWLMAAELDSTALHTHFNISSHTIQQLFIEYLLYARHCSRPRQVAYTVFPQK